MERLRKIFSQTSKFMEDLSKAFGYEGGVDSVGFYFKKIEKLVKNIIRHKFNQEEFYKIFSITLLER